MKEIIEKYCEPSPYNKGAFLLKTIRCPLIFILDKDIVTVTDYDDYHIHDFTSKKKLKKFIKSLK